MSRDYKREILSILVDWYESSPAYTRGQAPFRRRMMRLYDGGQTDFAAYNIENHIVRKDINQTVLELASNGLIGYEWMRGEQGHIISKVWLVFSEINQVYAVLKRAPKGNTIDDVLLSLMELQDNATEEWTRHWLEDTLDAISHKRSIGISLPRNEAERDDLLKAIYSLQAPADVEILERVFSIRCFADSKRFERSVKARIVRILKKYLVQDDGCTDEDALRLVGIVRYPEQFEFSGSLSITLASGKIDFSVLPFGGALTIEDVKRGTIALGSEIRHVLSIENRANYVEYVQKSQTKEELVLFHGGPFSPAKRIFLKAVASAMPEGCEFYHWGDIDYGGFFMLDRLRREIYPGVQAWRMNKQELTQYSKFTTDFSDAYRRRLESLLQRPELCDCRPCIEYMLKTRVRLEQEAMIAQAEAGRFF